MLVGSGYRAKSASSGSPNGRDSCWYVCCRRDIMSLKGLAGIICSGNKCSKTLVAKQLRGVSRSQGEVLDLWAPRSFYVKE